MALNYSTSMPPAGDGPYAIDRNWCLGDSLVYINANSKIFDDRTLNTTTALAAASATLTTQTANTSSTIITTLSTVPYARLNDGNQSGVAPIFGARAWVNFDGTGTIGTNQTIRGQGNVSSVLKNGEGDYTITFTTPMLDANYCANITVSRDGAPQGNVHNAPATESQTSTTYRFVTYQYGGYSFGSHQIISVSFIR